MDAHGEVRALCEQIRAAFPSNMSALARKNAEDATDCIETLTKTYMIPDAPWDWSPYNLTGRERVVAEMLRMKLGKTVRKTAMLDALYFDKIDSVPEIKILDVFVCKIRAKFDLFDCPYSVETIYGEGFRMVRAEESMQQLSTAKVRVRRCILWNGVRLTEKQAELAERLKSSDRPLKHVDICPRGSWNTFANRISNLRRLLAGHFIIANKSGEGGGYVMSPARKPQASPALAQLKKLAA